MDLPNSNFTPADKRVWLWKLATTAASILVFTVSYIFTDNINSAAASVAITVAVVTAVALTFSASVAVAVAVAKNNIEKLMREIKQCLFF